MRPPFVEQSNQQYLPIVRVGPNQIAHRPFVRNLLYPIQITRVIERVNGGRKSAMQAEYAIRYHCRHGQIVKGIRKVLPDVGVSVLSKALIVKAIDLGNLTTLVVPTENCDATSVSYFQSDQQGDRF